MKHVLVKDNFIVGVIWAARSGKETLALLRERGVDVDSVLEFPNATDVKVGDDVRSFSKSGMPLTLSDILYLHIPDAGDVSGKVVILNDDGWAVREQRDGKYYINGSLIEQVTSEYDEVPDSTTFYDSVDKVMKTSLHGSKLLARLAVRAHVAKEVYEPITYRNVTIPVTDNLLERLRNIVAIGESKTPWTLETEYGSVSLNSTSAHELLSLILARNETFIQWGQAVIANEIDHATTPEEVINVLVAHNIYHYVEELYG